MTADESNSRFAFRMRSRAARSDVRFRRLQQLLEGGRVTDDADTTGKHL